ncbi:hypothetical protein [Pseudonocardia acaciae]|uniref:hypothetical protein n=1 Tax=Pseudonocardia acaciae TaxID=551276 RepID=UPI00048C3303|nr:hypothetical protein [Pseudonocardia acaciae]
MKVHFVLTEPHGPIVASGEHPTDSAFLGSLVNLGHVVRLLRAGNVVPGIGQRLTVWIEEDRRR